MKAEETEVHFRRVRKKEVLMGRGNKKHKYTFKMKERRS